MGHLISFLMFDTTFASLNHGGEGKHILLFPYYLPRTNKNRNLKWRLAVKVGRSTSLQIPSNSNSYYYLLKQPLQLCGVCWSRRGRVVAMSRQHAWWQYSTFLLTGSRTSGGEKKDENTSIRSKVVGRGWCGSSRRMRSWFIAKLVATITLASDRSNSNRCVSSYT